MIQEKTHGISASQLERVKRAYVYDMWKLIFFLFTANLSLAYKSQIDRLKFVLVDIRKHINQPNYVGIVDNLEDFLFTEKKVKSNPEMATSNDTLAEVFEELRKILHHLLLGQEKIIDKESELLTTETSSFRQNANSLIYLVEKNGYNHKMFADVQRQIEDIISSYLLKVENVRKKLGNTTAVIDCVKELLDGHSEWTDLVKELKLVKNKSKALVHLIMESNEHIPSVAEMVDRLGENVTIPEPEVISYESIVNIETPDGTRKKKISTHLTNNSPLSEAEEMAKAGRKVLLIQGKQNFDDGHAILQESYSTPGKMKIGVLNLSPLPLSLPKYSRLIDEQATDISKANGDDKSVVLNMRGHEALKKKTIFGI